MIELGGVEYVPMVVVPLPVRVNEVSVAFSTRTTSSNCADTHSYYSKRVLKLRYGYEQSPRKMDEKKSDGCMDAL